MGTSPPGTETLPYTYTTQAEIDSIFSEMGVRWRLEDLYSGKGPQPYVDDIIDEATDVVNQYCEWRYYPEDMSTNRWVRRRASWVAAYMLAQRRGNPRQFVARYEEVMEDLRNVYDARAMIPRLELRTEFKPDHTNLVIDDRVPGKITEPGGWYYHF